MVSRIDMIGCGGEEEARDDHVYGLREDLLLDAQRRLGVELALVEVDGLLELEELLSLPAQPIELGERIGIAPSSLHERHFVGRVEGVERNAAGGAGTGAGGGHDRGKPRGVREVARFRDSLERLPSSAIWSLW